MKILFITCNGVEDAAFGGAKASIRNYELLKKYAEVDVMTVRKRSSLASAASVLGGYFPPVSGRDLKAVRAVLDRYDCVFFDGSHFGNIVKYVSGKGVKTICFFHNCEYDYIEVRFGPSTSLKKSVYKRLIARQEKLAARCAGINMVFTQRDAERIGGLYAVEPPRVAPLSLKDAYEERQPGRERECLLFGPLGQANEEAFGWFVREVSPYLRCGTRVAGKGFEVHKEDWGSRKVAVQGYVEDIAQLYADACCVAIPLLSGGGMKIKTAEALMFGKYIFGTDEAFVGYELDCGKVGGRCNTAQEFIEAVNGFLDRGRDFDFYNGYARRLYEEKYSLQASGRVFAEVLGVADSDVKDVPGGGTDALGGVEDGNKTVAVTVTFNRVSTLRRTLAALESQTRPVWKIVIVDNHSDEAQREELRALTEGRADVEVLWMEENLGGAGGFERGMRYAKERYGPDWYWIMDDDAYPRRDTLEKLLRYGGLEQMGCLAPLIWGVDWQKYQLYHHKVIKRLYTVDEAKFSGVEEMGEVERIDADAFVGTLFPRRTVEEEGFPDGGLFIYGDDTEYTVRISQNRRIYLIRDAVIEHNDPPVANAVFSPKTYWKLYYTIRNRLLIARKYNRGLRRAAAVLLLAGDALWQIGYSLVRRGLGKYRFLRIRFVLKGFADGVRGKKGKTVDPVEYIKRFGG